MLRPRHDRRRPASQEPVEFTLRLAREPDEPALARLAELDSAAVPAPPVLVAEVAGELWAAVSLSDGAAIADPFRPSAELAAVAVERARRLRAAAGDARPSPRPRRQGRRAALPARWR